MTHLGSSKKGNAEQINQLLALWREGDQEAYNQLITLLHGELMRLAHLQFRRERGNHTLQTNDLVSKLYLKLLGSKTVPWVDYAHFLNAAARAMRQILIDHARLWVRRVDGKDRSPVEDLDLKPEGQAGAPSEKELARLLSLNQAIEEMENLDPDMARIANLRLVIGLTLEETSRELDLPVNKVKREWLLIRKFLSQKVWVEMAGQD